MSKRESLADAPGTQRKYETILILRPLSTKDDINSATTRIRSIIDSGGGHIFTLENWGSRSLAYEIQKNKKGIYMYWQYLGKSDLVAELERNLRMLDSVMRYMTVVVAHDVDPSARPADLSEETFNLASITPQEETSQATTTTEPQTQTPEKTPNKPSETMSSEAPQEIMNDTETIPLDITPSKE